MSGAALEDATFCWNAKAGTPYCSIWGRAWDALSRKTSVSLYFSSWNPGFPWWLVDDGCYLPRTKSGRLFGKKHFPKDEGEMAFIKSLHPVGLYHFLQSGDDAQKHWASSAPGPCPLHYPAFSTPPRSYFHFTKHQCTSFCLSWGEEFAVLCLCFVFFLVSHF